jgi:predicted dehydrogenase
VERVLDSYQDVIDDPEVDVVYHPLANAFHAPWNLTAVAAGKQVLTEKPFATNRDEAQRVGRCGGSDCAGRIPLTIPPGDPASTDTRR